MRILAVGAVLCFVLFINYASSSESSTPDDISYEFRQSERLYSFHGSFTVEADYDCLVSILFDFHHLKNFVKDANDIYLIQQNKDCYDVCFVFKRLFTTYKSVYRKTLKADEKKIIFDMLTVEQSNPLLPVLRSSSGYYRITGMSPLYKIEYFQECEIEPFFLQGIFIKMGKKECVNFLLELKQYVKRTCH